VGGIPAGPGGPGSPGRGGTRGTGEPRAWGGPAGTGEPRAWGDRRNGGETEGAVETREDAGGRVGLGPGEIGGPPPTPTDGTTAGWIRRAPGDGEAPGVAVLTAGPTGSA